MDSFFLREGAGTYVNVVMLMSPSFLKIVYCVNESSLFWLEKELLLPANELTLLDMKDSRLVSSSY